MDFALHLPVNKLSFGQCSINLLKEFHKRGFQPSIFTLGQDDFASFKLEDDFKAWFSSCRAKSIKQHKRTTPIFRLWHVNEESLNSFSEKQVLFTFHETDQATEAESNIVRNNQTVLFSSKYSANIFKTFGCENVDNLPLGFDSDSFKIIPNRQYVETGVVQFGLGGKLEKRKQHMKILNLWAKKYGNNPKYKLNCALFNPFIPPEAMNQVINMALEGKRYFNINFITFMEDNSAYNDFLNSNSIMLGMSSAEGWGLPEFQSVALGKHALILNATGYKEWATPENTVLVNPTGKVPLADGVFFRADWDFNQGSGFDWTDEVFYKGMEDVIKRFKENNVNEAGLKLQEQFTWSKTVDKIMSVFENL